MVAGDTEFVLELKTYLQSFVCTQTCEVFSLDTRNYERLVKRRNPRTVDLIRQSAEVKLSARISRLHDNQVPLLRTLLFKMECVDRQHQKKGRRTGPKSPTTPRDLYDIVPHRGALIDLHGPGTVFHRTKMREKAKQYAQNKAQLNRGATTVGFNLRLRTITAQPLQATPLEVMERDHEVAPLHGQNLLTVPGQLFYNPVPNDEAFSTGGTTDEEEDNDEDLSEDEGGYPRPGVKPVFPTFSNWKSSDRALKLLEDRISLWHRSLTKAADKPARVAVPAAYKLQRVRVRLLPLIFSHDVVKHITK